MRKLYVLGLVAALVGAGQASALPTVNLLPSSTTNVTPGQSIVLTIQLIQDIVPPEEQLTSATWGIARLSGDAVITAATRAPNNTAGLSTVGGALVITPIDVFAYGGLALAGASSGTFTMGTVTVQAGNVDSVFVPVQRAGIDDWFVYDPSTYATTLIHPTLNSATLTMTVIPEPATASLLGLGLLGLVVAGSRKSRS